MADIMHNIRIESPINKVFEALSTAEGLSGWWTKWTSFEKGSGEPGTVIRFGFADNKMAVKFEVTKFIKNEMIEWKCIDEPGEWSFHGTNITFKLSEEIVEYYDNKKMTVVNFIHSGFKSTDDFYTGSNTRWGFFLLSLKDLLEKGKGSPVPDDIFMWFIKLKYLRTYISFKSFMISYFSILCWIFSI